MKYPFVKKFNLINFTGIVLIIAGLFFNEVIIRFLFTPYGFISPGKAMIIRMFNLISVSSGLLFFIYSESQNVKKFFFYLVSIFLFSVFSFTLLELSLRLTTTQKVFHPYVELIPNKKYEYYPKLSGVSAKTYFTTNMWGMRGDEPPVKWDEYYTILVTGGSTAECLYLDDKDTWPYLLQEKLKHSTLNSKIWVGNGGIDGHTTRGNVLFMEYVAKKTKPDCVMILCGFNDLMISLIDDYNKTGVPQELGHFTFKVYARSRLLQFLVLWKKILIDKDPVIKRVGHEAQEIVHMTEPETVIDKHLNEFLIVLPEFERNVRKIISIARNENIRLIFLTQPLVSDNNEYWRKIKGRSMWFNGITYNFSAATWWLMLETINSKLRDICRKEGIECIDIGNKIPHSKMYFYDTVHFNEPGAELISDLVVEYMIKAKENQKYGRIRKN